MAKKKMLKKDLKYFEKLMQGKKEKLLKELGYIEKASLSKSLKDSDGSLSSYSLHMADQASDSLEQESNFKLAEREGQFLHHLNEALYRIKEGTYGVCKACGEIIAKARLEAVPHTTMCIKCKTKDQDKKRRMA